MTSNQQKAKFKIAHSLQELEDELILTLKDQPLLKNNKEVNDDQDLFQNEELQNFNKTKHNVELRKKIKDLADVTTGHLASKQQATGSILPHYDDYSFKAPQIQVQETGIINIKKPKVFKNTENDFLTQEQTKEQKLGSEYSQVKIKKVNKNNKPAKQYETLSLLSFLNETAQDTLGQEGGKRNAEQAIEDALDSIRKKRITQFNAKRQVESVDISSIVGGNEEEELLSRAILVAQRKKNANKNFVLQAIKEEQDQSHEGTLKQSQTQGTVQVELNPITYKGQDKKYVRKEFDINGIKSGTTSAMFIKLPSERLVKKEEPELPSSFKDITPEELEKMKQQVSFLEDKTLGTGLAGALQFLRQNSLLGKQQEVGRTKDKGSINVNDPNDRIKLEYRNANGQLMKPKQAFRYLCAAFHGEGPGKNKIEKRKKRELMELQMKEKLNTDDQLLNMLSEHQRKTNQAHMVIDFGKKAASKGP